MILSCGCAGAICTNERETDLFIQKFPPNGNTSLEKYFTILSTFQSSDLGFEMKKNHYSTDKMQN